MGISGNKWAKLIISFTLKIVLHFFFYRTTFKLACMNTHTSVQPIPTQRHAHAFSLITFFPILRPPAGVMNFTRFSKYLPTFLFELNAYLASSCCAHSLSYKHSITGSLTHESAHISPTPGSIHLNNHPQPEVEVHKNYTLYTPVWWKRVLLRNTQACMNTTKAPQLFTNANICAHTHTPCSDTTPQECKASEGINSSQQFYWAQINCTVVKCSHKNTL